MTNLELQAESLTVLPLRLETIVISGGPVKQDSWLNQRNFNNQVGGDCLKASCNQYNWQANFADVDQKVRSSTTLKDVIEDARKLSQVFGPAYH
ncbi:hypothetical protein [Nitrolancea hollandica]|uniref:Uncharacterized protein n=1 Tax=Nitrolancea hollandica Lb TaxID=1129897 RepID=I4ENH5_9BACT|nr:hypothetical protein [Nitrolancea hollandica]CCF86238.1 hypothetical protein NITHO_900013 [Nitrolancea hollandica Lb]